MSEDDPVLLPSNSRRLVVVFRSWPRPCENSTRYKRTRNFEACGHAQGKKNAKIPPPLGATTKSDFVFTRPGAIAVISLPTGNSVAFGLKRTLGRILRVDGLVSRPAPRQAAAAGAYVQRCGASA